MSDAINMIDTAALGTPGCCVLRLHPSAAIEPFMRDAFDQFSETSDRRRLHLHDRHRRLPAGVPLRLLRPALGTGAVSLDPSLTPSFPASCCTISIGTAALHVTIGPHRRRSRSTAGPPLPVKTGGRSATVARGRAADDPDPPPRPDADDRPAPLPGGDGDYRPRRRARPGGRRRQPGDRLATDLAAREADGPAARQPHHLRRDPPLGRDLAARTEAERPSPGQAGERPPRYRLRPRGLPRRQRLGVPSRGSSTAPREPSTTSTSPRPPSSSSASR